MSGEIDQGKGRVKEAVGDITGNDHLKAEGKGDKLAGEIKQKVGEAKDKVEGLVDKAKDAMHDHNQK